MNDLDEPWDHGELAAVWRHVPAPTGALADARALLVDRLGCYELPTWTRDRDHDGGEGAIETFVVTLTDLDLLDDLRGPDEWAHVLTYAEDIDTQWRGFFPPEPPAAPLLAARLLDVQHSIGTRLTVRLAHDGGRVVDVAIDGRSGLLAELLEAVLGVPGMHHGDLADERYRRWLECLERSALRLAAAVGRLMGLAEELWPRPEVAGDEPHDDAEVLLAAQDPDVKRLRKLWEQLAELERDPASGHRRWNRLGDEMSEVRERLLARPGGLAAVQRFAVEHPDPFVRRWARRAADPDPSTGVESLAAWLRHPAIGLAELAEEVRPALRLKDISADFPGSPADAIAQYREGAPASWLGGPPLGPLPAWPRRDDGIALVHVAHLDLLALHLARRGEESGDWSDLALLPETGALQVFHDLETPGDEPGEGDRGAWVVRWVESPTEVIRPPRDASGPTPGFAPVHALAQATIPALQDTPQALGDRVVDAHERLLAAVAVELAADPEHPDAYPRPPSQVLGHGWAPAGEALEWLERLDDRTDAGGWVLLLDVAGVGPLDSWFGDEGHLEIWIRRGDLGAHRFDAAWALLR